MHIHTISTERSYGSSGGKQEGGRGVRCEKGIGGAVYHGERDYFWSLSQNDLFFETYLSRVLFSYLLK